MRTAGPRGSGLGRVRRGGDRRREPPRATRPPRVTRRERAEGHCCPGFGPGGLTRVCLGCGPAEIVSRVVFQVALDARAPRILFPDNRRQNALPQTPNPLPTVRGHLFAAYLPDQVS